MTIVEVCAGSIEDCLIAQQEGAHRIELNSALFLGGLTPSLGTLKTVIDKGVALPIICMVRPRGAGFCYTQEEFESMMLDAKLLLESGASGLAFGFLKEDKTIDWNRTKQMIDLCQQFHAESVFHKAFDIVPDVYEAIEGLIQLGCTRILTGGQQANIEEGIPLLKKLQEKYGEKIQLLCGGGVTKENIQYLIQETGIHQIHGSFKMWKVDPTTKNHGMSYAYHEGGDYEQTNELLLKTVMALINR